MLQTLSNTFVPVLWGGVFALVLNLPLRAVERQFTRFSPRMRRALSLAVLLCGIAASVFLGLWLLIPQLTTAVSSISIALPTLFAQLKETIMQWVSHLGQANVIFSASVFSSNGTTAAGDSAVSGLMNMGVAAVTYTAQQVTRFVIALVLAIYLLASKENLAHKAVLVAKAVFGAHRGMQIVVVSQRAAKTFASFMVGQCMEACILAGLFVLVLFVTGMPSVLPIATVIGITAFIPVFGSFFGCAFGFLLVAAATPQKCIWFLILFIVVQQFENNIIYPRVVGGRVGLPPLWVMMAVIIGGGLCGLPGLFLGIPAMSVLYQFSGEWVHARILAQQEGMNKS